MTAQVSDFDRTHVGLIMDGHGSWFSAHLLRLCGKADRENLEALRRAFPDHVEAFEAWRDSESGA